MLKPTPTSTTTATHRNRIIVDGNWHIPVRDINTLEGIAWGTGHPITYPHGEGWAVTHVGSVRMRAWWKAAR